MALGLSTKRRAAFPVSAPRRPEPQSSCPFKSARQKVYGLGYSLLVFVYEKRDDQVAATANLQVKHVGFMEKEENEDVIFSLLGERMLPLDNTRATSLAQKIMHTPPQLGYLTISNALQ